MASESDLPAPEDLAGRALTWFLRGGTWQALARELAWHAAQATGGDLRTIEWLTPLLETRLAEAVDGLAYDVDMASAAARRDHIDAWPHDVEGADTAATLDGYEAAVERLSTLYVGELDWAIALVEARRASRVPATARRRRRPRDVEIPVEVAREVSRDRRRFGWPRRNAA